MVSTLLTKSPAKQNEIENVIPGKPSPRLYIKATWQFPFWNLEVGRPLLGLASGDEVEQIQTFLADCVGMLKTR